MKIINLLVLFVTLTLNVSGFATSIRDEDPCFFRVTTISDKVIYVAGTIHLIKIEDIFSEATVEELKEIATKQKPILFIEHKLENTGAFEIIEREKEDVKAKKDWFSTLSQKHQSLNNEIVYEKPGVVSQYKIGDIFKLELWLAAPILSTHVNSIFYPNFGGTEYNLENDEFWKNCWEEICYLEDDEHYNILKMSYKLNEEYFSNWIQKSLDRLLQLQSLLKNPEKETADPLELKVLKAEKEAAEANQNTLLEGMKKRFRERGYRVIESTSYGIPLSVIERNSQWSNLISERLSKENSEEKSHPYMTIIGDGHLAAFNDHKSFISFLVKNTGVKTIERFLASSKSWKVTHKLVNH